MSDSSNMKSTDSFDTGQELKKRKINDENVHIFSQELFIEINLRVKIPPKIESDNVANRLDDSYNDIFLKSQSHRK